MIVFQYMAPVSKNNRPPSPQEHIYESPPDTKDFQFDFPEPPSDFGDDHKPSGGGGGAIAPPPPRDDLNFEDLAERFKKLNKK